MRRDHSVEKPGPISPPDATIDISLVRIVDFPDDI